LGSKGQKKNNITLAFLDMKLLKTDSYYHIFSISYLYKENTKRNKIYDIQQSQIRYRSRIIETTNGKGTHCNGSALKHRPNTIQMVNAA
jgi:hypothetical protein